MSNPQLKLEILSDPLDGLTVVLSEATHWGKQRKGPLGFPWDTKLGETQARFLPEGGAWWIEALTAPLPTERIKGKEKECIAGKVRLEPGDILRAGDTWLELQRGDSK